MEKPQSVFKKLQASRTADGRNREIHTPNVGVTSELSH